MSEPTLRGRLHRARKQLATRLRRRGILAPAVARVLDPANVFLPALPSSLVESTVQFASRWSAVRGLLVGASAVPESIAALAQGVIQAMLFQTAKISGIAALLTIGVVGTAVLAQQGKKAATAGPARSAKVQVDLLPRAIPRSKVRLRSSPMLATSRGKLSRSFRRSRNRSRCRSSTRPLSTMCSNTSRRRRRLPLSRAYRSTSIRSASRRPDDRSNRR